MPDDEEAEAAARRLREAETALEEHAALRRTQEMEEIDRARQFYLRNRAELLHVLGVAHGATLLMGVPDGWTPATFDSTEREYSIELGRRWHNYVAGAKTVVDHMRILFDKQPEGLLDEYAQARKQHIDPHKPVVDFVHQSRNIALHQGVFNTGYSTSFTATSHSTDMHLSAEALLNRYKSTWSGAAKKYIKEKAPRVLLHEVVQDYSQPADDLYGWFESRFYEYHYPTMAAFEQLADEYRQASEIVNPGGLPPPSRETTFPTPEAHRRRREAARRAASRPVPPKAKKTGKRK